MSFTNLLLFFWIKITWKMPKSLTIQKPNVRQFSLSDFAAALKPNTFEEKNHDMACQDGVVDNCYELLSRCTGEA
jgi:hypothetical protein